MSNEYRRMDCPLVLGGGKRLFPGGMRTKLRLVQTRSFPTGVVLMRYAVERPAAAG